MSQHTKADVTKLLFSIQKEHLSYFASDDELIRQQKLQPLRELIIQYLSLVKHRNKFSIPEFEYILQRNIEDRFDFNAYETQQAFDILEKYASNLMSFPWRKEFRTIKLYCGFFKHNLARHLFGVERILNLMGYQFHENIMTLDGPVDPDVLIEVSRNCFIASCECQIINEIYSTVLEIGYACSHEDIYNMRKCIVGSAESMIQMLCAKEQAENLLCKRMQDRVAKSDGTLCNGVRKNDLVEPLIDLTASNDINKKKNISNENRSYHVDKKQLDPLRSSVVLTSKEKYENQKINNNTNPVLPVFRRDKKDEVEHDCFKIGTRDDHIRASVTAVNVNHKESPEHVSTRDQTWGYVLDHSNQAYANSVLDSNQPCSNSVLDHLNSKLIIKNDEEDKLHKGKLNNPSLQQNQEMYHQNPQFRNPQYVMQQPNLSQLHYEDRKRDLIAFDNPQIGYSFPSMNENVMNTHSQCQQRFIIPPYAGPCLMTNSQMPYNFQPSQFQMPSHPWQNTMTQSTNSFAEPMHLVHVSDSNIGNSNAALNSNAYSVEENRRSLYDNVPTDKVEKISYPTPQRLNPTTDSSSQADHLEDLPVNNYDGKMHNRKFSESSLSNNYTLENENTKGSKNQSKLRSSEISNSRHSISDKETGSPPLKRNTSADEQKKKPLANIGSEVETWTCHSCTFLNKADKKICEVCCRSRTPAAEIPLQSGGHECPKCTLVNDQNATHCSACGDNLTDSPTYI